MKKRILSIILVLVLVFGVAPIRVMASNDQVVKISFHPRLNDAVFDGDKPIVEATRVNNFQMVIYRDGVEAERISSGNNYYALLHMTVGSTGEFSFRMIPPPGLTVIDAFFSLGWLIRDQTLSPSKILTIPAESLASSPERWSYQDQHWILERTTIETPPPPPQQNGTVTISYNANGGTGVPAGLTLQKDNNGTVTFNHSATPTRSGHVFTGWQVESSSAITVNQQGENVSVSFGSANRHNNSTLNFIAQWAVAEPTPPPPVQQQNGFVTIRYNANGGTGAPNNHTVQKDNSGNATFNLSNTIPTRSGHTFLGWRLENDSAFDTLGAEQRVTVGFGAQNRHNDSTLTYFAQWAVAETPPPVTPPVTPPPVTPPPPLPSGNIISQWAVAEVNKANNMGLIPDSLVGPTTDFTRPITRAEFAGIAVRVFEALSGTQALPATNNPFIDTRELDVLKAYNMGIMIGFTHNTFSPNTILNREQAATALTRVFQRSTQPGWTYATQANFPLRFTSPPLFADDAQISPWARDSVYFMAANGIIAGVGNNMFQPRAMTTEQEAEGFAQATREQALAIAVRMVETFG